MYNVTIDYTNLACRGKVSITGPLRKNAFGEHTK